MLYVCDLASNADLLDGAGRNTDDRPVIEFLAPRLTRMNAEGDKDWFTGAALAAFYDTLDGRLASGTDPFSPASGVRDARRAGTLLFHYALCSTQGDAGAAAHFQSEVRSLVPEVIAAQSNDPGPTCRDAPRDLRDLRDLQAQYESLRTELDVMQRRLSEFSQRKEGP
jgi:hypothetical protein